MVRVFLKGGVWKNSEDEVLKAAVQKYGKQQWARVASLLNRKTAKQAKARWYEWLDPSIKKTEWSRAEEEKLLHLAKLLPSQWKTIGPMVGRTATQCQEHYERLLDQAAAAAASPAGGSTGPEGSSTSDQLLRVGQIDSHPETKPAKPDPIDMDEDELEMLQEARARLANTLGKKAKRKQREKMLAQAKRLADLQKRRELKAAGLLATKARKKAKHKNEIDLGIEIPFYKPAPAGFHDTSAEQHKSFRIQQERSRQVDLHQINEGRYRTRDYEEAAARKREERRLQLLEKMNSSYQQEKKQQEEAMRMASAMMRQRGSLQLPEPTVTDAEMAELAKNYSKEKQQAAMGLVAGARSGPTAALLGGGDDQSLRTVPAFPNSMASSVVAGGAAAANSFKSVAGQSLRMGTAASVSGASTVIRRDLVKEANQLRRLERGSTPLLAASIGRAGGEHGDDDDDDSVEHDEEEGTAFDEDRKMPAASSATSRIGPGDRSVGGGPDAAASVGASTWATSANTLRELARQERRAAKRARQQLEEALASLPEPQYEYELAAPASGGETAGDDENDVLGVASTVTDEQDQADVEAAQQEEQRFLAEKKYRERSSVLQRPELPRPAVKPRVSIADDGPSSGTQSLSSSHSNAAFAMIQQEMLALIQHDNYKYPVVPSENGGARKKRRRRDGSAEAAPVVVLEEVEVPSKPLAYFSEASLEAARALIDAEFQELVSAKVAELLQQDSKSELTSPEDAIAVLSERALEASRAGAEGMVRIKKGWVESPSDDEILASLQLEFEELRQATESLRKKNEKIEVKLKVVNGGYAKVDQRCTQDARDAIEAIRNARIEQSVYRMLQSQEVLGGMNRVEQLQDDVKRLQSMEAELQKQYGDLIVERRRRAALEAKSAGTIRQS